MSELKSKCHGETLAYFHTSLRCYVPLVKIQLREDDKKGWTRFDYLCPQCHKPCKSEEKEEEVNGDKNSES